MLFILDTISVHFLWIGRMWSGYRSNYFQFQLHIQYELYIQHKLVL